MTYKGVNEMKMLDYVIFSIDNADDVHTLAKFTRWLDTKRVLGELQENPWVLIGKWRGKLENSFLLRRDDFTKYVVPYDWVKNQKAIMRVSADKRMAAQVVSLDEEILAKGFLMQVPMQAAFKAEGFTYCPKRDIYWVLT
jgi:hypothetical protein